MTFSHEIIIIVCKRHISDTIVLVVSSYRGQSELLIAGCIIVNFGVNK